MMLDGGVRRRRLSFCLARIGESIIRTPMAIGASPCVAQPLGADAPKRLRLFDLQK